MIGKGMNRMVNNLMYTERGKIILSIILGLGLASIFRKFCQGKDCFRFIGPKQNEIRDKIFSFDSGNNKCYKMREESIKCGSNERTIDFAL